MEMLSLAEVEDELKEVLMALVSLATLLTLVTMVTMVTLVTLVKSEKCHVYCLSRWRGPWSGWMRGG